MQDTQGTDLTFRAPRAEEHSVRIQSVLRVVHREYSSEHAKYRIQNIWQRSSSMKMTIEASTAIQQNNTYTGMEHAVTVMRGKTQEPGSVSVMSAS